MANIQMNITIDEDIHATAKALAAYNHITLGEFVEQALCAYIQGHPVTPPALGKLGGAEEKRP